MPLNSGGLAPPLGPSADHGSMGAVGVMGVMDASSQPGHALYARAEDSLRRKKEKIKREKQDAKLQSNPMLNRKSLAMANQMKQSAQERLTAQRRRDVQVSRCGLAYIFHFSARSCLRLLASLIQCLVHVYR